jgi:trehalose 6-phosphate synthase
MRLTLRFVLPLTIVLGLLAYAAVPLVDRLIQRWSVRDLDARARLIATSVRAPLGAMMASGSRDGVQLLFNSLTHDERLVAMGYCASPDSLPISTSLLPSDMTCELLRGHVAAGARWWPGRRTAPCRD